MLRALALTIALAAGGAAEAQCSGPSLLDRLSADQRAALDAEVARMPFAQGLLWQAEREGQTVTLVGTMHIHDPRLDAIMARVEPMLEDVGLLLLEVTPAEEAQMTDALASDPSLMFLTDGRHSALHGRQAPALVSDAVAVGSRLRGRAHAGRQGRA